MSNAVNNVAKYRVKTTVDKPARRASCSRNSARKSSLRSRSGGGSTYADDGVLYPGCGEYSYTYSVSVPEDTDGWSMGVVLLGPDGIEVTSDYVYDAPTSGRGKIQICDSELAGGYTLQAFVEGYDTDYNKFAFELPATRFQMRQTRTRTALTASTTNPSCGDVVRLRIATTGERPRGYFPTRYTPVTIQRRVDGVWRTIRSSRGYTDAKGKETVRLRFTKPCHPVMLRAHRGQ